MNIKEVPTVQLAEELLRRAQHVDAVMNLVQSGAVYYTKREKQAVRTPRPRRSKHMKRAEFVAAVPKDGAPRNIEQYAKLANCTYSAAYVHLRELEKLGQAHVNTLVKPRLYTLNGVSR